MSLDMGGRTVLVTGAARGIGAATASLFHELHADVVGCDLHPGAGMEGWDGQEPPARPALVHRVLDVRDPQGVDRLVDDVSRVFGRVDVLVNNAGGTFWAPFLDVSAKGEATLVAENFTQVTHVIRRVVPLMTEGGAVVNVTSVEAHQAAPGFALYAAMKAALENLTRSLALELAPRGIRVNAVAPDGIPSPGELEARQQLADAPVRFDPAVLPPLGHFGEAGDAAAAIVFLASAMARFITGTTLHVDGGTAAAGGWHRRPEGPA